MLSFKPKLYASSSTILWRLFILRSVAIVAQALTVIGVHYGLDIALPLMPLAVVIGLLAISNVLSAWRLRRAWPVSSAEIFAQLLLDVAALTALLYLSGGSSNPFISLYLLPLIIVATTLSRRYAWAMAGITVACYTGLMAWSIPLAPHHSLQSNFNLHLIGMWFNFVLSAILIAFLIVRLAASLRERDRMVAAFREENLRNERIVALGALAAGAAHELGTPLSTMLLLTESLERRSLDQPALREDVQCLQDQVLACKRSLSRLLAASGVERAEETVRLALPTFLDGILEQWSLLRPTVPVTTHCSGTGLEPAIVAEPGLSQTLLSLLNNAADVSPQGVELHGHWDDRELTLEIRDHGPGVTPAVAERAMEPFFTTKAPGQGFGLGLFLANASIERLGGSVRLFNHAQGGACTRVTLPLALAAHG